MFQKWHNAYEEALHVPLIIHSPKLFIETKETKMLSSHLDILPTLLGLASIDATEIQEDLRKTHSEVHPLVGRNLTPLLQSHENFPRANEPLYFMTDDEVSKGLNQVTLQGEPYHTVIQPNHLESVIVKLSTGENESTEIWKYTYYFDNPQFWNNPNTEDTETMEKFSSTSMDNTEATFTITTTKTQPLPSKFELYNVTRDPLEKINLAHPHNETPESMLVQLVLTKLLRQQRSEKRLYHENK